MLTRASYRCAVAFAVCICCHVNLQAIAQEEVSASGRTEYIEEIIVTARRREERLQDVPLSATAISGQLMHELSIQDLFDIQFQAPNLQIAPFPAVGGDASISMRGQSQFEPVITLDPVVGIYVDEVYLGRATGALLNLVDLERVEVLMGPQGTLYGRNTTGGVINLISRKNTTGELGGMLGVTGGNYGRKNVTAAFSLPIVGDKLAARLSYRNANRDGFGTNTLLSEDLDDEDAQSLRLNLSWFPKDDLDVLFSFDSTRQREYSSLFSVNTIDPEVLDPACLTQTPPLFGCLVNFLITGGNWETALAGDPREIRSDVRSRHELDVDGAAATITARFNGFSVKSITAYRELSRRNINDIDGSEWAILHPDADAGQRQFSQEIRVSSDLVNSDLDWLVGVFYFDESGNDDTIVVSVPDLNPFSPSTILPEGENTSAAAFGHLTYDIGERSVLSAGARYTRERRQLSEQQFNAGGCTLEFINAPPCRTEVSKRFDGWSYTVSLDHRWSPETMVYVSTSRGFKSGGFNARASKEIEFQPFDPEIVSSVEVGLKSSQFDNRMQLDFAYFYDDYSDIQRARLIALSQTEIASTVSNAASAYVTGGELRMTAKPMADLIWDTSVGLTVASYKEFEDSDSMGNTIDKSNLKFPKTPRWNFSTRLNYTLPLSFSGYATAQVAYSWRDKSYSDVDNSPALVQDSFGLVDLRLNSYWTDWNLEIALVAKNVTDETYLTDGLDFSDQFGYTGVFLGPPRTYYAELIWRFGSERPSH